MTEDELKEWEQSVQKEYEKLKLWQEPSYLKIAGKLIKDYSHMLWVAKHDELPIIGDGQTREEALKSLIINIVYCIKEQASKENK